MNSPQTAVSRTEAKTEILEISKYFCKQEMLDKTETLDRDLLNLIFARLPTAFVRQLKNIIMYTTNLLYKLYRMLQLI